MAIGTVSSGAALDSRITMYPRHAAFVTKSDADVFDGPVNIRVYGAGDIVVTPAAPGMSDVTLTLAAGDDVPFMVVAVKSTGTTATNILAIW